MKNRLSDKNVFLTFLFVSFIFSFASSQNVGDYQSVATGNWNAASTWQKCTSAGTWAATGANVAPPTNYISGTIYIQSGTNVTVSANISEGFITVNGGTLTVASAITLTIPNGTNATDLSIISGNLNINGTLSLISGSVTSNSGTITNSSTITVAGTLNNNSNLNINSAGSVSATGTITNNSTLNIAAGITFTNSGALANNGTTNVNGTFLQNNICSNAAGGTINNAGVFTIATAKTFTNNGTFNNLSSGTLNVNTATTTTGKVTNSGIINNAGIIQNIATTANCFVNNASSTLRNSGTITNTSSGAFKFNANSLYQHNYSSLLALPTTGYILPYATWDAASTCEILAFGDGTVLPTATTVPSTISFGNIIWNNSTQPGNINLNGVLKTCLGSFSVQNTGGYSLILKNTTGNNLAVTGSLNISGTASLALTAGATNFGSSSCALTTGNLNITGGTLDLTQSVFTTGTGGTGTINLNGNLTHTGGIITKTGTQSATIYAIGTSVQTLESIGFAVGKAITFNTQTSSAGNVSISSSKIFVINQGTIFNVNENTSSTSTDFTVDGTLQVSGTINVLSNASLAMGINPLTDAASGSGNFILNSSATLLTKHPDGISTSGATGSIQSSGTRTLPSDANYTFNAGTAQVTGNGLPTVLTGILTINNSTALATAGVSLSQSMSISNGGSLYLTAGRLITTSTNLITIDTGAVISPTGGSALSFVDGPISKIGFTLGTEFIFPTGDTAKWARIGFIPSATNTALAFTAEYFKRDPHTYADPSSFADSTLNRPNIKVLSYKEYWYLNRTAGVTNGQVKLYWEDATFSGISSALSSDLRVAHYRAAGPKWYAEGTSPLVTAGSIQSNATITTFSSTYPYFTFGAPGASNPLPIELTVFDGKATTNGNLINWSTASETNNDHFELERGNNVYSFEKIASIDGSGNSTSMLNYNYMDKYPERTINYYRLKQIDYNGEFSYSEIISIDNNQMAETFVNAYPNPTTGNSINIAFSENVNSLIIYNILGDVIYNSENLLSNKPISLDVMAKGVYIIKALTSEQKLITSKFTKQ
ncbi:MAG: hypothetical protein K0Q95_1359 [Bacteroidota bacterium]|jgi:hypothetical protein|nr:hypothetical protein [Bacteroidota bacterium]